MTFTQAMIIRAVKAALEPARKMGLPVAGYKVTFSQGVPCVDVTLGAESPPPASVNREAVDVEAFKSQLGKRHAARRP